jgi:hypothetical protein
MANIFDNTPICQFGNFGIYANGKELLQKFDCLRFDKEPATNFKL